MISGRIFMVLKGTMENVAMVKILNVKTFIMKASTNKQAKTFTLELSFSELHIIMKAMTEYQRLAYNPKGRVIGQDFNETHAKYAEMFHEEFTNFYCNPDA